MKKIYTLVMGLIMISFLISLAGCPPQGTPLNLNFNITSTFTPTVTFTRTPTLSPTPTIGSPTATPTFTFTPGSPTATPTNTPLIIFDDSLHVATGEGEFDGGGGASTSSNLADTTSPYAGTTDATWVFSNLGGGFYAGWNVTGPATDLSAYTTLSFYAKTSRAYTGNGIEFFGGGNSVAPNHLFAVTTSYAQYSYTFNQPSNTTTIFFGVVANTADVSDLPGSGPLTVFVDNIQYQ